MKALLKGWVGLYFSILLTEKTKQSTAKWLSQVMTSEGRVKWLGASCSQGAEEGTNMANFSNRGCACYFCKSTYLCKCLSNIYSLKITASSMLVLSHSFFVSTHLHGISRLEKRMHANQPLQISRAEYEVFLFILLITVQSILGKGACREVQLSTSALPEVVLHFYLFLPVLQQFSRGLGRCFERDKIIQCTHTDS